MVKARVKTIAAVGMVALGAALPIPASVQQPEPTPAQVVQVLDHVANEYRRDFDRRRGTHRLVGVDVTFKAHTSNVTYRVKYQWVPRTYRGNLLYECVGADVSVMRGYIRITDHLEGFNWNGAAGCR